MEFTIKQYIGGNFIKDLDGNFNGVEGDDYKVWGIQDIVNDEVILDLFDDGEEGCDDILVEVNCRVNGDSIEAWLENSVSGKWVSVNGTIYEEAAIERAQELELI